MPIGFELVVSGGTKPVGKDATEWAKRCKDLGAGWVLPTSMDGDGTLAGYEFTGARSLITNSLVVLMDEPFGSLDSQTRNGLQEFLLGIWGKRGDTIIFVTHNVDEAIFLSDEIVVLSKRPARIIKRIDVELPRPRDRTSEECNRIRRGVLKILEEEMKSEGRDEDRRNIL